MRKKIILSVLLLTGILVTKPLPVFGKEHNVEISSGEIRSFVDSYLHSKSLRDYGLDNPTIRIQNYSIDINRLNTITISVHSTDRYNYPLNLYTSNRRFSHLTGYSN